MRILAIVEYNRIVNKKEVKGLRRNLRNSMTPAEVALWSQLKAGKLDGTSWRRQFSVGNYILDFYCPQIRLCIELDGHEHFTSVGDAQDDIRTEYLLKYHGIQTLRFENSDIFNHTEGVIGIIGETIQELLNPPPNT